VKTLIAAAFAGLLLSTQAHCQWWDVRGFIERHSKTEPRAKRSSRRTRHLEPLAIEEPSDFGKFFDRLSGEYVSRDASDTDASLLVRVLSELHDAESIDAVNVLQAVDELRREKEDVPEPVAPTPRSKPKEANPVDWSGARKAVDLKPMAMTRLEDGQPAAVMRNLRTVKKGDIVSATYKGRMYRWRVVGVSQGGIQTDGIEVVSVQE